MRQEQDYFNRRVVVDDAAVWVTLRPRGSELRDLTKGVEVVHWFSALPGVVSIVGWVLHHTVYRSRWLVDADPVLRLEPMPKRAAERAFLDLLDWLQNGRPPAEFVPTPPTEGS